MDISALIIGMCIRYNIYAVHEDTFVQKFKELSVHKRYIDDASGACTPICSLIEDHYEFNKLKPIMNIPWDHMYLHPQIQYGGFY